MLGAAEAARRLASSTLALPDYVDALIARAAQAAALNATIDFVPVQLRQEARQSHRAPLHGLPVSFKANIDIAGRISSGGTPALGDWRPKTTAPTAQRLLDSGAMVFAKDNLHELALGSTSHNPATGAVRNPWNPAMISGGSSGGTAAQVAAAVVAAGIGSDTAGSCRIPAALCGCVGFRPSLGRYPMAGVIPMTRERDTLGPLARSVDDIDLIDRLIDPTRAPMPELALSTARLGVPIGMLWDDVDSDIAPALQQALALLTAAGATLVPVDLELPEETEMNALALAVVARDMGRDIDAYLRGHDHPLTARAVFEAMASLAERGLLLAQFGPDAFPEALYHQSLTQFRPRLQARLRQLYSEHRLSALVLPTTPLAARPIGEDDTVLLNGRPQPTVTVYIRSTDLASAAQMPSISVPAGFSNSGLPVGLMFDGLAGDDARLLALARAFETVRGPLPYPPM